MRRNGHCRLPGSTGKGRIMHRRNVAVGAHAGRILLIALALCALLVPVAVGGAASGIDTMTLNPLGPDHGPLGPVAARGAPGPLPPPAHPAGPGPARDAGARSAGT